MHSPFYNRTLEYHLISFCKKHVEECLYTLGAAKVFPDLPEGSLPSGLTVWVWLWPVLGGATWTAESCHSLYTK